MALQISVSAARDLVIFGGSSVMPRLTTGPVPSPECARGKTGGSLGGVEVADEATSNLAASDDLGSAAAAATAAATTLTVTFTAAATGRPLATTPRCSMACMFLRAASRRWALSTLTTEGSFPDCDFSSSVLEDCGF
ncbi:hypothetical protein MTO96_000703 [Rhipicephalus appendiculatus]